ncbi:X-Pro aminopeptidase [Candidatus Aerophobetes bacterium]|uniref:X-Pro aminopeptidase n=1 Tax=Aerophobetes bacterium TaxID=2030807 RepID=A0A2A4X402_UNCAE|nr:MAG: X-Pro aminopeptidase [Candidatus Aerophobetes bacterium]
MTLKAYYQNRIEKLCATINQNEGWIIEHPQDIFYLTGFALSKGTLLVAAKRAVLLVDGRYQSAAKAMCSIDSAPLEEETFERLFSSGQFKNIVTWFVDGSQTSLIAMEAWEKRVDILHKKRKNEPKKLLGVKKNPVLNVRAVKDDLEIEALKASAELLMQGYKHLVSILQEGITEKEAALEFEIFCKKQGAEALSFDPIIAFGEKGAYPHYHPQDKRLKKGDAVLLDLGVMKQGYASDMTRCFCFDGEYSARMQLFFDVTKKAKEAALSLVRAGVSIAKLEQSARSVMKEHSLEALFTHSLGHGVGLDVHEMPVVNRLNTEVLKENMVITIEPGLYQPSVGGIRLEDTIVVTKEGYVNFFETLSL